MARRRKTRSGKSLKWVVTLGLVALLGAGAYVAMPERGTPVPKGRAVAPATSTPKAAVRPARSAGGEATARRPVAPVSMPRDPPRSPAVPRPKVSIGP